MPKTKVEAVDLIPLVGNPGGRFGTKEGRVAKLIAGWDALKVKMAGMVERGNGHSETARLAYATLLMMETGIRVGNESSAEGLVSDNQRVAKEDGVAKSDNPALGIKKGDPVRAGQVIWQSPHHGQLIKTYGLTTLLNRHVSAIIDYGRVGFSLSFTGKKNVEQELEVYNDVLLKYLPNADFKGPKDVRWLGIDYPALFKFVKKYVGRRFTPKDVRAAKVNLHFMTRFARDHADSYAKAVRKSEQKAVVRSCLVDTAAHIGHTPGVCKSAYLSKTLIPGILSRPGTAFTTSKTE